MHVARFTWKLVAPWLQPFLLIPLIALWLVASIVVCVWTAWEESK